LARGRQTNPAASVVIARSRIARLGEHVARQEELLLHDPKEHDRVRSAVVFAVARSHEPRPPIWAYPGGAALAAAAVVAALLFAGRPGPRLGFSVGEHRAEGIIGDFLAATKAPLPVAFSDGTRVTLEPGARGRISSTSVDGADLVVESGRAAFAVVPRRGNRWQVSTGPFVVHVTGTRFEVEWQPERDTFVLELHEGHVRITGCGFGEGHAVNAGERVEATCGRGEFRVSRLGTDGESS
jgi:ferric-dicitrate binding protein FerR (iron transport regulator)